MTSVMIFKNQKNKWVLSIIINPQTDFQFIRRMTFHKLIDAINTANSLKLHITNENVLPLRQYVKAG